WTQSAGADNYSIFVSDSNITEINGNLTLIQEGITDLNYTLSIWSGLHYVVAVAYNESGYTLSTNNIFIDVKMLPKPFVLSTDADPIDIDGSHTLNWTASLGADNYTIYVHDNFITEINGSVGILEEGFKDTIYPISGLYDGDYYYKVLAFNQYGNFTSECVDVHIIIQIPPPSFSLDSNAEAPDDDGTFYVSWDDAVYANNFSFYYSSSQITDVYQSNVYLLYNGTNTLFNIQNWVDGTYYFAVVAYNNFGNYTTDNLIVTINLPFIDGSIADRDAYVQSDTPDMNYGNDALLLLFNTGSNRETYIYFNFADKPEYVAKAEIIIQVIGATDSLEITTFLIEEVWSELGITWNNKPAYGEIISTFTVLPDDDFWHFNYSIDVTRYINGNGISICLKISEGEELGGVLIGSKENPFYTPPKLIWTEGSPPVGGEAIDGYPLIIFMTIIFCTSIISIYKKKQTFKQT
ncbi:MAG: CBM96 family carbohydrate-binding protein, partial [Promethearchaeota archaeon]